MRPLWLLLLLFFQISNGVGGASCGNGNNNWTPRGTTSGNSNCDAIDVDTQPGPMNEGARTSPRAASRRTQRPPCGDSCAADAPPPPPIPTPTHPPGKWCSTIGGRGSDNPTDPLMLDDEQRSKAASFFFQDFSSFEVSDAPRSPHRRPPRWPYAAPGCTPGRRARDPPPHTHTPHPPTAPRLVCRWNSRLMTRLPVATS